MLTHYTFLMVNEGTGSTASWTKVVDIKDYPDMIAAAESLENTTLSQGSHSYEPGLKGSTDAKEFTANYTVANVTRLQGLTGTQKQYALWFGGTAPSAVGESATPTGSDGKIEFEGTLDFGIVSKGINEVRELLVRIMPASEEIITVS